MYFTQTTIEISAAHQLNLSYDSPCRELHGHNWKINVHCSAEQLNEDGMVVDFTKVKRLVKTELDHKTLNDVLTVNPTAEKIACHIVTLLNKNFGDTGREARCYRVDVEETSGNVASFESEAY